MTAILQPVASGSFLDHLDEPLRAMYAYWRSKRGGRTMPRRQSIEPSEIPRLLPHIMITEVIDHGARFRYRLSGGAVTEAFGRSLTNQYVDELLRGRYRDFIVGLYLDVCRNRRSVFCESRYRGKSAGVTTKRLLMPLSEDDIEVNQVLAIQTFHYASCDRSVVIFDNMDAFVSTGVELDDDEDGEGT